VAERTCTKCGESKPWTLEFFGAHRGRLHVRCRPCRNRDSRLDREGRSRPKRVYTPADLERIKARYRELHPLETVTCPVCGESFERRSEGQKRFCSTRCQGRDKRRQRPAGKAGRPFSRTPCEVCGVVYRRTYGGQRTCGRECGWTLRLWEEQGAGRVCELDSSHLVVLLQRKVWPTCQVHFRDCRECGSPFVTRGVRRYCSDECSTGAWLRQRRREPREVLTVDCWWCGLEIETTHPTTRYCSRHCSRKAKKVARRGREAGWASHYTWAEVMRLFLMFDRRCAYCDVEIEGQPEPDHVVPLSRGGSNSITNILPTCHACNAGKRHLLLDEWAADRAHKGLDPVRTAWDDADPRFKHLTAWPPAAA
jgi:endogenous inhibitor of DNA gyrase (YacG/DUF329 family)